VPHRLKETRHIAAPHRRSHRNRLSLKDLVKPGIHPSIQLLEFQIKLLRQSCKCLIDSGKKTSLSKVIVGIEVQGVSARRWLYGKEFGSHSNTPHVVEKPEKVQTVVVACATQTRSRQQYKSLNRLLWMNGKLTNS
ncbi:MAG TPA: hypothetical protein PKW73_10465, partial [Candidatus Obscuribacter sp.]|nr:hypothetical protein [Candidatus Obscuribacter sp.]